MTSVPTLNVIRLVNPSVEPIVKESRKHLVTCVCYNNTIATTATTVSLPSMKI